MISMTENNILIKNNINLALQRANTAVEYDTSNDFHNAISAYIEAVELLVCVLQEQPYDDEESDTKGLESICDIYKERIHVLRQLSDQEAIKTTQRNKLRKRNTFHSAFKDFFIKASITTKKKRGGIIEFASLDQMNHARKEMNTNATFDISPRPSQSLPIVCHANKRNSERIWTKFCL